MIPGEVYSLREGRGRCQARSPSHSKIPVDDDFPMAVLAGVEREAHVRPCSRMAASSTSLAPAPGLVGVWVGLTLNL